MQNPLPGIRKQFAYYQQLGERTMEQLDEEQLTFIPEGSATSIAIIVKHLRGNMLSRWTDFLSSDGEKPWRDRDAEFEPDLHSRKAILAAWKEGWDCLFHALDGLSEQDLDRTVYIRNQEHSVLDAIQRQMMHYAYHVGQMILFGKWQKGADFQSLSIPLGGSAAFNQTHFDQPQHLAHYTDEWMERGDGKG